MFRHGRLRMRHNGEGKYLEQAKNCAGHQVFLLIHDGAIASGEVQGKDRLCPTLDEAAKCLVSGMADIKLRSAHIYNSPQI
jgi:hypothetical protein